MGGVLRDKMSKRMLPGSCNRLDKGAAQIIAGYIVIVRRGIQAAI
jgi:hypothetical protein